MRRHGNRISQKMSRALAEEIRTAPTGEMLRDFLDTQVSLITSLPSEAAKRVHEIAIGNLYSGARFGELAEHIMETGRVTRNRATLIARTDTARVSSALTMVRAQHVGSVRPSGDPLRINERALATERWTVSSSVGTSHLSLIKVFPPITPGWSGTAAASVSRSFRSDMT